MMTKRFPSVLTLSLVLSGCATIDKWFAPENEQAETPAEVVAKSDMAESEIDPDAAQNDQNLMGSALEQPTGFLMASQRPQEQVRQPLPANDKNLPTDATPHGADTPVVEGEVQEGQTQKRFLPAPQLTTMLSTMAGAPGARFHQDAGQSLKSNQKQIFSSVENDYDVFRALNHQHIKNNTAQNQYKTLNQSMSYFVMDLVANLSSEHYGAPLVVRPMTLKVADVANPEGGKELITSMLAAQMKDYGFKVYDGRKPKGRFTGDEVILETVVDSYGDQFVLYGTLTVLKSNIVAGSHNTFISDFFFRNIKDGVEVFSDGANF